MTFLRSQLEYFCNQSELHATFDHCAAERLSLVVGFVVVLGKTFFYLCLDDCEPFSHFKNGFGFFNVQNYAIVIFIEDVLALLIVVERTFTC